MNDRHHTTTTTYYSQPQSSHFYNNNFNSSPQSCQQQPPRYNNQFNFSSDQPLFDYQAEQYRQTQSQPLMPSANVWSSNGQLTPSTATSRAQHHRESSLSSLGSAGPASPYNANTSNPQVAGELHYDYNDYQYTHAKPLTPIHTPSQEQFLTPHYTYYQTSSLPYNMSPESQRIKSELMPAPEFGHQTRPPMPASIASNDSPATPPAYEDDRQRQTSYRGVPKLERTMTDIYSDELYNPNFTISAAPPTTIPAPSVSPHADLFNQRLQAANSQHLSASNSQLSMTVPPRDKSPFRQGSPLAPVANNFQAANLRFNTATQMREQQKAEADARALQQQIQRSSPSTATPQSTISPKDVDLVYHESEEDRNAPLFPPQQKPQAYKKQPSMPPRDPTDPEPPLSQQSFASMATTRRESSSDTSNAPPAQPAFNFIPPSVPGGIRVPQQYPFVPQSRRQPSNVSTATEDFPTTLTSMDSSGSDYASGESADIKKPANTTADSGTYTCTYHGCTLRFDSPAKLQRHKREGHRGTNAVAPTTSATDDSIANRNSQAGPHKCERINPSTGKPCNTIFSRPYDLTRHEDTIHNARKQKVHCPICTEEKTFSRNDALTRHMRVVHPQYADQSNRKRRGGS